MNIGQSYPAQIKDYTIEKELGRGLFDVTYLAKDLNDVRWMLKVLDIETLNDLGYKESEKVRIENMFWQEAVKLAMCSGTSHIVETKQPFRLGTLRCLPLKHFTGYNLRDRPQPILPEEKAIKYITQVAEALRTVHSKGLVHRDVRPDNIFLDTGADNTTEAILTNFALAVECNTELTMTRKDEIVDGFSPEELYHRNRSIGPYTDIYSLSATLYELLTGKIPVSADKRPSKNLESPRSINPNISKKISEGIMAGMSLEPRSRPATIEAWLLRLGLSSRLKKDKKKLFDWSNIDWSKWSTLWTAAGVILTLVTTLLITYLSNRQEQLPEKDIGEENISYELQEKSELT